MYSCRAEPLCVNKEDCLEKKKSKKIFQLTLKNKLFVIKCIVFWEVIKHYLRGKRGNWKNLHLKFEEKKNPTFFLAISKKHTNLQNLIYKSTILDFLRRRPNKILNLEWSVTETDRVFWSNMKYYSQTWFLIFLPKKKNCQILVTKFAL